MAIKVLDVPSADSVIASTGAEGYGVFLHEKSPPDSVLQFRFRCLGTSEEGDTYERARNRLQRENQ